MIGAVWTGVKVAWRLKHLKTVVSELRDVFVALSTLKSGYAKANEDGEISPTEAKRLIEQMAVAVEQGMEAEAALRKLL
jgi:hypothetical protein